ncbi:MAG: peptidoglycan-binding protein [Deltaproteobacteria bacterium]|nr:peptidoglycan-binding protein [Deltaproteobacteria bacterium]
MPLRSRLFADNKALQACLVSDPAHVVPGARGEHVTLIQSALVRLRFLEVRDALSEPGYYGPRTAAAVLAYKRQFQIINRKYQTQADNIVGRMTIASLDHAIWVLDGGDGAPRAGSWPAPHPHSPPAAAVPSAASPPRVVRALTAAAEPSRTGGGEAFEPPLSDLPQDIQDAVRRSNDAKKPDELMLFPFVAKHEGPLPAKELSARFGGDNASTTETLKELHTRMKPFDIWKNIRIIINVFRGVGSKGLFCTIFDRRAFFAQMDRLTTGPRLSPDPNVVPVSIPLTDSKFCRDMFNAHGPRDTFREIVKQGPGLHICIPQAAAPSKTLCDLHIDDIQQGQVCSRGFCIPIVNGQTIEHLRTVGPWLIQDALEKFRKIF